MTERKSLESERAELVALADEAEGMLDGRHGLVCQKRDTVKKIASALRSLAAQDQKPVAWRSADDVPPVSKGQMREYVVAVRRSRTGKVHTFSACYLNAYPLEYRDCCPKGDGCDGNGCDDGCPTTGWFDQTGDDYYDSMFNPLSLEKDDVLMGWRELPQWGEDLSSPPAAGWDDAIEACKKVAEKWLESFMGGEAYVARSIVNAIEALRHNAPPDSGAGELACTTGLIERDIAAQSALARIRKVRDGYANQAKFADVEQASYFREFIRRLDEAVSPKEGTQQLVPDHGGADAVVEYQNAAFQNTDDADHRLVLAAVRHCASSWVGEARIIGNVRATDIVRAIAALSHQPAPVAANASAELQNDLAEMLRALGMSDAAQPRSPHEVFQSAIAEMKSQIANASAEARLREALEKARTILKGPHHIGGASLMAMGEAYSVVDEALSAHPHASDCDKQGER